MRKYIFILILIVSLITSCASAQLYESGGMTYNIQKDGIWGAWSNISFTGDKFLFQYNKTIYTLINYDNLSHPSDYKIKIELIDKEQPKNSDGWYDYQGKIYCLSDIECIDRMQEYYQTKKECKSPFNDEYEKYYVFQCTIKTNKKIPDLVKKGRGAINVFYNGVGRAWSF